MIKKILLSLTAVAVVVGGVAGMSAYEAHVINVTAHIENALSVDTTPIEFGTVFPQEYIERDFTINLSSSFLAADRVDDVEYKIVQKPKPKPELVVSMGLDEARAYCHDNPESLDCYLSLCPFLSKTDGDPGDENDTSHVGYYVDPTPESPNSGDEYCETPGADATGRLSKIEGDLSDVWIVDLKVPPVAGSIGQDWPIGCPTVPENAQDYGCDLWIEVTGISEKINLENKDENWNIISGDGIDGTLSYMPVGDSFKGVVMATGLEADKQYQLTINGPGTDVSVGSTDDLIAGSACDAGNLYRGGWWDGSLPVVCQSGGISGWEGFYVFDLVAANDQTALAVTDGSGDLYYAFDVDMRSGSYSGVKFFIKENFSPWQGKMFEVEPFDFIIY